MILFLLQYIFFIIEVENAVLQYHSTVNSRPETDHAFRIDLKLGSLSNYTTLTFCSLHIRDLFENHADCKDTGKYDECSSRKMNIFLTTFCKVFSLYLPVSSGLHKN